MHSGNWLVLLALVSCSNATASRFNSDAGSDSSTTRLDDGGPSLGEGGPSVGGGYCSGDLRSVLDASGNIIETCAEDSGCSAGKCVPACNAAASSKGNIGCLFMVSTPSFYTTMKPPCFAAFVANAWPRAAKLEVTHNGSSYDVTKFGRIAGTGNAATWLPVPATGVPPGEVAVLFLSHDPSSTHGLGGSMACPVTPAINASTAYYTGTAAATGRTSGFTIASDTPVSAYDIMPFGGAKSYLPSAQLLMPVSAWGDNFVVAQPPASPSGSYQAHWLHILAAVDNTEVSIVPTLALPLGVNVPAAPANAVSKFTLNAGEFIQWQNTHDISGSVVSSTQPVAVVGGQLELCWGTKTSGSGGCDSAHQLVPPVRALGDEYAIAPIPSRLSTKVEESISYRIVGAVDGTTLTFDPPVAAAPQSTMLGKVDTFETTGPFTVKSQDNAHPFYVAQIIGGAGGVGDEEYVNVLPPAQFLNRYIFFADPSYTTTQLVIIRVKGPKGFADVTVAGVGKVTGWKSFGASYEYASVSTATGPESATSDSPFGVVVWGFASYASYAYPAGGNAAGINQVVVPVIPH